MRGRFFLVPENTRFKPIIFQIETIKVINIFAGSFSPLLTSVKSSGFSLESLPSSETGIYPKVLFINLEEEVFLRNLVSAMTIF